MPEGIQNSASTSPFFCFAVGISPDEGAQRANLARLQELVGRSRWLVNMRWLAAGGLVTAATLGRFLLGLPVSAGVLYIIAGILLAYNFAFRRMSGVSMQGGDVKQALERATFLATLQIVADLVVLTAMLHFSGGIENPFFFYFIFHVIIASILLSRRASFYIATLAVGLFFALVLLERFEVLAHRTLWGLPEGFHLDATYTFAVLVVFASTMYLAVYFAADIVMRMRARDNELISTTVSLEKGTLQLQEAFEKIRALEERKSEFLRVAAHQLRSPLSAIRSLLDVVLDGFAGDVKKQQAMLGRAHDRADLMLGMINDMLALSRLKDVDDEGRKAAAPVEVSKLMAELGDFYAPRAAEKGITLEVKSAPEGDVISADADDIRQVINNLLDNAVNYTLSGGRVTGAVESAPGEVVVRVSDTGIGIDEESLARIFEEFYRAPNAKKQVDYGTGLGLSIVKRTVEKWHGTVRIESRVSEGTTFVLTFPSAKPGV